MPHSPNLIDASPDTSRPVPARLTEIETDDEGNSTFEIVEEPQEGDEDFVAEAGIDDIPHDENLCEFLEDGFLTRLGSDVVERVASDESSRESWLKTLEQGLKLLGLEIEQLSDPFEGACAANHPLILEAAVKFVSKVQPNLLPPKGPVKAEVIGDPDMETLKQANRVVSFMNYQITKEMPEFYPGSLRMLFTMALCGTGFKKMYYRPDLGRPFSEYVKPQDFIASNHFTDLDSADCYTHRFLVSDVELKQRTHFGMYRDINATPEYRASVNTDSLTSDEQDIMGHYPSNLDEGHELLEHHCYLNLPDPFGYDIPLPFIVTVHRDTGKVLSIRKNWKMGDPYRRKQVWFARYVFFEGLGFYGLGLIHMLWSQQMTLTSGTRSLVDSATLANMQGGFVTKSARIRDNDGPMRPGEWREVEGAIQDLSKSFFSLPYKEPPAMLFQMLNWIDGRAGKFADSMDQVVSDSANYGPTGTTLALLEASAKMETAIQQNLHRAQAVELQLLHDINGSVLPIEGYPFRVAGAEQTVLKADFDGRVDVVPVSDPNLPSAAHRASMAQAKMSMAAQLPPGLVNQRELAKEFYMALGVDDIDKLIPEPAQAKPNDPVTDIQMVVNGQPIKAFPGQDHLAHMAVKQAFIENPTLGGGSQTMLSLVPILQANIREHQLLQFQQEISAQIGAEMQMNPQMDPNTDPKVLGKLMSEAAKRVLEDAKTKQFDGTPEEKLAEATLIEARTNERAQNFKEKEGIFNAIDKTTKRNIEEDRLALEDKKINAKIKMDLQAPMKDLGNFAAKEAIKGMVAQDTENDRIVESEKKPRNSD